MHGAAVTAPGAAAAAGLVPGCRVWLGRKPGGPPLVGDREAALLAGIDRTGSIKEGAKLAGVSYRTAWAAVRAMERALGRPVVASRTGGPGGGASRLTDETRELLRIYRELERHVNAQVERAYAAAATSRP